MFHVLFTYVHFRFGDYFSFSSAPAQRVQVETMKSEYILICYLGYDPKGFKENVLLAVVAAEWGKRGEKRPLTFVRSVLKQSTRSFLYNHALDLSGLIFSFNISACCCCLICAHFWPIMGKRPPSEIFFVRTSIIFTEL